MNSSYAITMFDEKRGWLIRYLREQLGMTQADLARKLGVSVNTVCDWEQGRKPSVKNWYRLSRELNISRELLEADLSDSFSAKKVQIALLRKLDIPPEIQQIIEEAIIRYYGEEPLHAVTEGALSPRAYAAAIDKS